MIRRKEYTQLTGLLKNKALNELNGWVKEGYLTPLEAAVIKFMCGVIQ